MALFSTRKGECGERDLLGFEKFGVKEVASLTCTIGKKELISVVNHRHQQMSTARQLKRILWHSQSIPDTFVKPYPLHVAA